MVIILLKIRIGAVLYWVEIETSNLLHSSSLENTIKIGCYLISVCIHNFWAASKSPILDHLQSCETGIKVHLYPITMCQAWFPDIKF